MSKQLPAIVKRTHDEWIEFCKELQSGSFIPITDTKEKQQARKAKVLKDYNFFVKTYFSKTENNNGIADSDCAYFHIDAANNVLKKPDKLSVFEWPREHAKTVHACLIQPMWLLIHGELDGMILQSRTADMAANALGDIQAHLEFNELFKHDWGEMFNFGSWADGDFTTKDGIRFLSLGRDQAPQGARKGGRRPNLAVCSDFDDYEIVNNQKRVRKVVEMIFGALINALAIKKWRIIVEGNRIHPQSILAHVVGDIKQGIPKREGIYHSKVYATQNAKGQRAYLSEGGLPAWKERYTVAQLAKRFNTIGVVKTKAEFYHEHSVEGEIFKESYFQWKPMPKKDWKDYIVIIGYFDPSFEDTVTSDYKAVRIWGLKANGEKHCLKSFCQRTNLINVFRFMSEFDNELPKGIGVIWYCENQFFNRPIADALAVHNDSLEAQGKRTLAIIKDMRKKEHKFTRIIKMEPEYCMGKVYYNLDEMHNNDMIDANNQLKGIEAGYNSPDDAPDADEGNWYYLDQHKPSRNFTPIIGKRDRQILY